jgi:hypothetical protein
MGASEDDILGSVLDVHPEYKASAQKLMQSGASAKDVIDSIGDVVVDKTRSAAANQSWGEWGLDVAKGLAHGVGSTLTGLGETATRPTASDTSKAVGNAAQNAGQIVEGFAGSDYRPSEARISDPRTWWDAPKALAEAAPGIAGLAGSAVAGARIGGAAGLVGGPLAEVTVPVGAALGGLGGAALYAFYGHWGEEAKKHAEDAGRSKPNEQDFEKAQKTAMIQAGIDSASVPLGGLAGKVGGAALGGVGGVTGRLLGPASIKGTTALGTAGQIAGRTVATDAALAGSAAGDQIASDMGRGKDVDWGEALDAADKAAAVGTGLRGARAVGTVTGSARFRDVPDAEAVGRVVDHMSSKQFPGDLTDSGQTAANIKLGKAYFSERTASLADVGKEIPLDATVRDALSYLNKGAVLDKDQLSGLRDSLTGGVQADRFGGATKDLFEAMRDQNGMNYLALKAGHSDLNSTTGSALLKGAQSLLANKVAGAGLSGTAAALGVANPGLLAGAGAAAGATALGLNLGARALGLHDQFRNPVKFMADRFGSAPQAADPLMPFQARMQAAEAARRMQEAQAEPNASPPPSGPANGPSAPPVGPRPMGYAPPQGQPPLAQALGQPVPEPRFAPRQAPETRGEQRMAPDAAPMAPDTASLIQNVMEQSRGENRPFLDVLHEHHRSAASIASNRDVPRPVADAARAEQSRIWKAIQVAEAEAHPAEVQRARSSRTVQEIAPGPEEMIAATDLTPARTSNPRQAPPVLQAAMEAAMAAKMADQQKAANDATSKRAQSVFTRPKSEAPAKTKAKSTKAHGAKTAATGSKPRTLKNARKGAKKKR